MAFLRYHGGFSQIKIPINPVGTQPPGGGPSPWVTCFLIWDVSEVVGDVIIEIDDETYGYAHDWALNVPRSFGGTALFETDAGPATAPAPTIYAPDLPNAQTGE